MSPYVFKDLIPLGNKEVGYRFARLIYHVLCFPEKNQDQTTTIFLTPPPPPENIKVCIYAFTVFTAKCLLDFVEKRMPVLQGPSVMLQTKLLVYLLYAEAEVQ